MSGNKALAIHDLLEEQRTNTFVPFAEMPFAPNQWAAIACSPSWTARIPLRQPNRMNQIPDAVKNIKSCSDGAEGKGKPNSHPNQSQAIEANNTDNHMRPKIRQAGRVLMLCLFSTFLLISILLIGENIFQGAAGWNMIGAAAILGWLSSLSVNLEETSPKSAWINTVFISMIAVIIGCAAAVKGKIGIEESQRLALIIAAGTMATAARNYLDVAEAQKK
ncbi:hypothetical protein [uncultured Anaerolinea sp.]|uniref:hypothetical protein n=2 Tax=Anaerolinea TaxID=233189 RepID=UPI0026148AEE|nr:hypothetical protein [uncultured Anaerolinea sp.]